VSRYNPRREMRFRTVIVLCDDNHREQHIGDAAYGQWAASEPAYVQFSGPGVASGNWSRRRTGIQTPTDEGDYRKQTFHVRCRMCHRPRDTGQVGRVPVVWTNATLSAAVARILDAHPGEPAVRVSLRALHRVIELNSASSNGGRRAPPK
jgi:hypothetical protein